MKPNHFLWRFVIDCSLHCILLSLLLPRVYGAAVDSQFTTRESDVSDIGSTSENITAGAPILPKAPDFVSCNGYYGVGMDKIGCNEALDELDVLWPKPQWVNVGKVQLGRGHSYVNIAPVIRQYPNQAPICKITIDLAGYVDDDKPVYLFSETIKLTAKAVINQCVTDKEQGGFATLGLSSTVDGLAKAKVLNEGYKAPYMLSIAVTDKGNYSPGKYDPAVNENLQIALTAKESKAMFKSTKANIPLVLTALAASYKDMGISRDRAWWQSAAYEPVVAENVVNLCRRSYGTPDPRDCEAASAQFFTGMGTTPLIKQGFGRKYAYGTCVFELTTENRPARAEWGLIRSVADFLIFECMLGPNSPQFGGDANYQAAALAAISNGTLISTRDSTNVTGVGDVAWPQNLELSMKRVGHGTTPVQSSVPSVETDGVVSGGMASVVPFNKYQAQDIQSMTTS